MADRVTSHAAMPILVRPKNPGRNQETGLPAAAQALVDGVLAKSGDADAFAEARRYFFWAICFSHSAWRFWTSCGVSSSLRVAIPQ
jgi:hypothetical protein